MKKILLIIMFTMLLSCNVKGEEVIEEFDFDRLEEVVEDKTDLSFNEMLKDLLDGKSIFEIIKDKVTDIFRNEIFYNNGFMKAIIVISIISAVINIVASDIRDKSVAELVGLIGQIMIIGIAAASFKNSINLLQNSVEDITDIINSAVPFIVMLLTATGNAAAIGGGGIIAIGTSIVAKGIKALIIPVLVMAILLKIVNILSNKQLVDKLSVLFMTGTKLGLKLCAYIFVFLITLEKISGGAINKGVGGTFKSVIKMVPVVGDVIGGISDVAINTIGAISSGVGLLLVVIIIVSSLVPLIEIGFAAFMFKLIAAVLEPICDKRTIEIIDTIGDGNFMILSALFIISAMFVMACAIILCGVV